MRTCVVCRSVKPKRSMTRVVRGADGTVSIDRSGKLAGRGTYVCDDPACRDPQRLAQGVARALSVPVAAGTLLLEVPDATA
jgi:predicted RNA-binding protein YlxR (DUF448 family)